MSDSESSNSESSSSSESSISERSACDPQTSFLQTYKYKSYKDTKPINYLTTKYDSLATTFKYNKDKLSGKPISFYQIVPQVSRMFFDVDLEKHQFKPQLINQQVEDLLQNLSKYIPGKFNVAGYVSNEYENFKCKSMKELMEKYELCFSECEKHIFSIHITFYQCTMSGKQDIQNLINQINKQQKKLKYGEDKKVSGISLDGDAYAGDCFRHIMFPKCGDKHEVTKLCKGNGSSAILQAIYPDGKEPYFYQFADEAIEKRVEKEINQNLQNLKLQPKQFIDEVINEFYECGEYYKWASFTRYATEMLRQQFSREQILNFLTPICRKDHPEDITATEYRIKQYFQTSVSLKDPRMEILKIIRKTSPAKYALLATGITGTGQIRITEKIDMVDTEFCWEQFRTMLINRHNFKDMETMLNTLAKVVIYLENEQKVYQKEYCLEINCNKLESYTRQEFYNRLDAEVVIIDGDEKNFIKIFKTFQNSLMRQKITFYDRTGNIYYFSQFQYLQERYEEYEEIIAEVVDTNTKQIYKLSTWKLKKGIREEELESETSERESESETSTTSTTSTLSSDPDENEENPFDNTKTRASASDDYFEDINTLNKSLNKQTRPKFNNKWLQHVFDIVCAGDIRTFTYLMKWCAFTLQFPDKKAETAVVLFGKQGAGKNCFSTVFCNLLGPQYALPNVDNVENILGNFNGIVRGKKLIVINEMRADGKKTTDFDRMKSRITELGSIMNEKNEKMRECWTYENYILISNHKNSIRVEDSDRRFFILEVLASMLGNKKYFNEVWKDGEDRQYLWNVFMQIDLKTFRPSEMPNTKAKKEIQNYQKPTSVRFIEEKYDDLTVKGKYIAKSKLYERYVQWCGETGENKNQQTMKVFEQQAREADLITSPGTAQDKKVIDGVRVMCWMLKDQKKQKQKAKEPETSTSESSESSSSSETSQSD